MTEQSINLKKRIFIQIFAFIKFIALFIEAF